MRRGTREGKSEGDNMSCEKNVKSMHCINRAIEVRLCAQLISIEIWAIEL